MLESDVNWAVKFLASRREFSHSFDQYLKQVCLPYNLIHHRLLKTRPAEKMSYRERKRACLFNLSERCTIFLWVVL